MSQAGIVSISNMLKINRMIFQRSIHATASCESSIQAGKTRTSRMRTVPLTYEMSYLPEHIGSHKNWNSWNTSAVWEGPWTSETAAEDVFIRKFMTGTWHNLIMTEIIIKRQFNMIRVAAIVYQGILPRKMYFLIGYTEEMLSNWLQCPVKLEIQTIADRKDIVYKYI